MNGVETYVTLAAGGYIRTKQECIDALDNAEKALIKKMSSFDYEHQLFSASQE